ncbi:MAG: Glu/Leu/Phe/Val dehydrogenase dimerization domain-containing protein [Dehalococcoidia bacterium]|jgi:glutamate dehydrogenase (NAD(P)+)
MPVWMNMTDQLGPEKLLHVYDPETGMKGVVVVDTSSTMGAAGGLRLLPDFTTDDIFRFARATSYKFAFLDFPVGGAKAGIWAEPEIHGPQRRELFTSFGNAVKTLLCSGLTLAADMGTDRDDIAVLYETACTTKRSTGLSTQVVDGEPLEDHASGYSVVVAVVAACQAAGLNIKDARVAIEGFGKTGGAVARYISESGAKVVAISTINGAAYNKDGLDVMNMLQARKVAGDKAITECRQSKHIKSKDLYGLKVDILVPGARHSVITKKNVKSIKAKVIACAGDSPITDEAEEILFKRGIISVPDFISNAGGMVFDVVDAVGGSSDDVFRVLRDQYGPLVSQLLTESKQQKVNPRTLAVRKATEKILAARKQPRTTDLEQTAGELRKRLGIK